MRLLDWREEPILLGLVGDAHAAAADQRRMR